MVEFTEFIKRFNNLEKFLVSKSGDLLMKHEGQIISMSNAQLLEGKNVDGKIMQRGYSAAYGKIRKKAGLQTARVDLKLTGTYQDTKRGFKSRGGLDIRSAADYEAHLRGNFPNHVGLTKKNAEILAKLLSNQIAVMIDKYLD